MTKDFEFKLNAGFEELGNRDYFAKQAWMCCQSCGVANLPDDCTSYVFYHDQDAEMLLERDQVYLSWGGDAEEIADVFREVGLAVDWDGSERTRIRVYALASAVVRNKRQGAAPFRSVVKH